MKDKKDMCLWLQVGEDVTDQDIRSALYDKGITRCILNPLPEYDWSAFRREAAKDMLAGMMSNVPLSEYGITDAECMAEYAVLYAEKLIEKLKQE